jgi:Putative transposase
MTLDAVEFLRRFLLHVLPRGLQRIRHYGFFANGVRKIKLPLCRQVLGQTMVPPQEARPLVDSTAMASRPPSPSDVCPICHIGRMQVQETWFPQRIARDISCPILVCDTS